MTKLDNADTMVELDVSDDELDVEIVDDTPQDDKNKPSLEDDIEIEGDDEDADEEIKQYGAGVQKRIKKLTYDMHQERRAREEQERISNEAVDYAKRVNYENNTLKKTLADGENVLIGQAKGRVDAQLEAAKKAYKEAYEAGDSDAITEAQVKLSDLQNEAFRVSQYRPQQRPPQQQPQQHQPPAPNVPKPDKLALEWNDKNEWFNKDQRMTGFAYGVHAELVEQGVDPREKEYYNKMDEAMRASFPDKFADGKKEVYVERKQVGSVVAPARRSSKAPRKVQLTSTQVSVAKRLGVPIEEYAKQMLKDEQNV
jgi:hypothetical protein